MLQNIATYDLPLDYVKKQEGIVIGWSAEQHKTMAQKYLDPAKLVYLVVGDAATQVEPLKKLGLGDPILIDKNAKPVQH
jgi:zinc protease